MSLQDTFDRILASLHQAALDDALWPAVSALIDEACRTKGNILVSSDGRSPEDFEIFFARFCFRGRRRDDWERRYFEAFYPWDECVPRLLRLSDSQLVPTSDLYTERKKNSSPTYNKSLPCNHTRNGLYTRLNGPDGSDIVWGVADPADGNDWSFAQVETIKRLLPHLRQFVGLRQALADARALGKSLAEFLDNTRSGVIHLDRRGRIAAANDRARDILREKDGLSDLDGFLRAWPPASDAELQRLLARALPPFGGQGAAGAMTVRRPSLLPQLVLHVSPVGERDLDVRPRRIGALVLVVDPASRTRVDSGLVAEVLGLTPAESQVAVLLADGRTVRDIALATGRSISTVRWHMRHVFDKAQVSRQAELVRLVLSLAGVPELRS